MLYAATRPDVVQGGYYVPEKGMTGAPAPAKLSKRAQDEPVAARLWETAEPPVGDRRASDWRLDQEHQVVHSNQLGNLSGSAICGRPRFSITRTARTGS